MDLDGDGVRDVISGSYPGELYLFRGTKSGAFEEPVVIRGADGEPIHPGRAASVHAVDWDRDGDLDLLVGDIAGQVWWLANASGGPALSLGPGTLLGAAGRPIRAAQGDAGPVVVDWDGNGTLDLVLGGGDGAVLLYPNQASEGGPTLGAPRALRAPSAGGMNLEQGHPPRLGGRAKPCVVDWNGDGALDLLVGDVLVERPDPPGMTPEQEARRARLERKVARLQERYAPVMERLQREVLAEQGHAGEGGSVSEILGGLGEAQQQAFFEAVGLRAQQDLDAQALGTLLQRAYEDLQPFQPSAVVHGHVWLLLREP